MIKYYVEKYADDGSYMNGEMSSSREFTSYVQALEYFNKKVKIYKRGFLVLSKLDKEHNDFEILEEIALGGNENEAK